MKRRNFLAMIPFVALACCKPKSKGTFEPYVPEDDPSDELASLTEAPEVEWNTLEELWIEYKKAIDFGNFTKFKTKHGMIRYLKKQMKIEPFGKSMLFCFAPSPGKYIQIKINSWGVIKA